MGITLGAWSGHAPLARHDDRLTSAVFAHSRVRVFSNGEQVRLDLFSPRATVRLDDFRAVDVDALERVHGDEDDARVRIDTMLCISIADSMQYCESSSIF